MKATDKNQFDSNTNLNVPRSTNSSDGGQNSENKQGNEKFISHGSSVEETSQDDLSYDIPQDKTGGDQFRIR